MTAALYTLVRYLVTAASAALVQHGWTVAAADGATLDAVTQLVVGSAGVAIPAAVGVLTGTVRWTVARLKRHHVPALLHAAGEVVGGDPGLAAAAALASGKAVP